MFSVILDVAGPALVFAFGVIFGGILAALILLVETVLLWRLRWATFWRGLLGAFLANVASAILGFLWFSVYLVRQEPPGLLFYIGAFLLSILVEAGILMLLKRNAPRENWRAALIINIASYALIAVAVAIYRAS
jgi:hypothetical protein